MNGSFHPWFLHFWATFSTPLLAIFPRNNQLATVYNGGDFVEFSHVMPAISKPDTDSRKGGRPLRLRSAFRLLCNNIFVYIGGHPNNYAAIINLSKYNVWHINHLHFHGKTASKCLADYDEIKWIDNGWVFTFKCCPGWNLLFREAGEYHVFPMKIVDSATLTFNSDALWWHL